MPQTTPRRSRRPRVGIALALVALSGCGTPPPPGAVVAATAMHRTDASGTVEVRGRVIDRATGGPAADAVPLVVLALPRGASHPHRTGTTHLPRSGGAFVPPFLVVPVGERVVFENRESICHGFFSSSKANAFDLGLLQPDGSRAFRFERPGRVHVYCSLHAGRQATILVAPTPWFATVDALGHYAIRDLPPGAYVFETCSERHRPTRRNVVVPESGPFVVDIAIDAAE